MRSMLFATGCLLLAGSAGAQVLYRCKGADSIVSIQSGPCAASERDLGARYYAPVEDSPEALERRRQADAEMERRHRQLAARGYSDKRTSPASDTRAQQRARCESARRYRDDTLERLGTGRTFDILRSLNESVQRACNGL